jgi:shikimate kinase
MNKNIVIIGMPGSGKSTIGYMLSKKIDMGYIDMDEYIEMDEKKSIKEMFQISEDYFRDVETRCAVALSKLNSHIIATGGGVVKRKENINIFKENCIIVFLNRPLDDIIKDIDTNIRPLLAEGKNKLYQLYNERINLYKEYCDIEIMNTQEIPYAVDQIIDLVANEN